MSPLLAGCARSAGRKRTPDSQDPGGEDGGEARQMLPLRCRAFTARGCACPASSRGVAQGWGAVLRGARSGPPVSSTASSTSWALCCAALHAPGFSGAQSCGHLTEMPTVQPNRRRTKRKLTPS